MRLFLLFVAEKTGHKVSRLILAELTCAQGLAFLQSVETDRHNHVRTRHQRLAAIRGFFDYLARRVPEMLKEAQSVAAVPTKRTTPPETFFLERDEVQALFASLPSAGASAVRDRALLLFLYNTGARVQEVADLRYKNLELEGQPRVHLHGKGDKWRVCPLWKETLAMLKQLVAAVHLLEAGVEANVICGWLGHGSLETTNRYAEINLRMKEAALQACQPPASASSGASLRKPIWREDADLMKWLKAL